MLSTAIIVFRETLEIAMIIGVVMAATRGLAQRSIWVAGGLLAGALGAGLVAYFARSISESLSGMGQECFNAAILFSAAIVIGWTVVWMRKHARGMTSHLRQVGHEVTAGKMPLYSLSLIIGLAMLREGSEIVLFIYSMLLSGQSGSSIVSGSLLGLALGLVAGVMLYYGLLKIPARYALKVTSWLLILLVAGLASQGAGYLSAAGYFPDMSNALWDTSWLLSEGSLSGKALHSLIGYSARPTAVQLLFYIGTLCGLVAIMFVMDKAHKHLAATAAIIVFSALFTPSPAHAIDHFYSPIVNKGELEIEYVGNRTFDHHSEKNNIQAHETELEYGMTDHWKAIIAGAFEKQPGESIKSDATQLESVFEFTDQGQYWMDAGLLTAYAFSTQRQKPDSTEVKLLLQKDTGKFTHLVNIGFDQNIGRYSGGTGGPDYSILWSSRWRANEWIQPGFEIQSDLGKGPTLGKFNAQQNYVGPALYGKLADHWKYETAFFFGTSAAASTNAMRLNIEYELYF